jgi:hypothetical protein
MEPGHEIRVLRKRRLLLSPLPPRVLSLILSLSKDGEGRARREGVGGRGEGVNRNATTSQRQRRSAGGRLNSSVAPVVPRRFPLQAPSPYPPPASRNVLRTLRGGRGDSRERRGC